MRRNPRNDKKRILIADDDPGIVEVLTMMLEDAGYAVDVLLDGKRIAEIQEQLPDVILLDVWLSGSDGRDICKRLKSQEKTKHIPIIMLSANHDIKLIAAEAGADDCISKPFDMNDLLGRVHHYTGAR